MKCPFWSNYWYEPCNACHCRIENSVSMEIDAMLLLQSAEGKTIAIHIEMKRDRESLSLGQAEAYRPRAKCFRDQGRIRKAILAHHDFVTVRFCGMGTDVPLMKQHFDRVILHERARGMFPHYPTALGPGSGKSLIPPLAQTVLDGRTSLRPRPKTETIAFDTKSEEFRLRGRIVVQKSDKTFWEEVKEYQLEKWPNVQMTFSGPRTGPPSKVWSYFYKDKIQNKLRFEITWSGDEHVALFDKKVERYTDFCQAVEPILSDPIRMGDRGTSWQSVKIIVPPIDPEKPIQDQTNILDEVFSAAEKLYEFYRKHATKLLLLKL
jgi:hypothetical protein